MNEKEWRVLLEIGDARHDPELSGLAEALAGLGLPPLTLDQVQRRALEAQRQARSGAMLRLLVKDADCSERLAGGWSHFLVERAAADAASPVIDLYLYGVAPTQPCAGGMSDGGTETKMDDETE
ncbi:MAG: hypothetical protein HUU23_12055 [Caldilineales bacterium]|nr:hypothetical protein [Caldilineales bacterium]